MNNPFDETLKHNILIGIKNAKNCVEIGQPGYALDFLKGLTKMVELTDTVEPSGELDNFANCDEVIDFQHQMVEANEHERGQFGC